MFEKIYLIVLLKDMHLCVQSVLGLLNRPGLPLTGADSASQSDRSILDEINMRGLRPRPT